MNDNPYLCIAVADEGVTDTAANRYPLRCLPPAGARRCALRRRGRRLCEDCCMAARTDRARKTPWQYLRPIKGDYLRPSPVAD